MSTNSKGIVVLGMHRSGTSSLAGTLIECGVFFGDVCESNPWNKKGNRENVRLMKLHENVLKYNGGAWDAPPEGDVHWPSYMRSELHEILATYCNSGHKLWGFKDPRTLFTLNAWQEAGQDLHYVATFRHPWAVVKSLRNRSRLPRVQALRLWLAYNRRLLQIVKDQHLPLVQFVPDSEQVKSQYIQLIEGLGLQTPENGLRFFDSRLQHFSANQSWLPLPTKVKTVYNELCELANPLGGSITSQTRRPAA